MTLRTGTMQFALRFTLAAGLALGVGAAPASAQEAGPPETAASTCASLVATEGGTPDALLADCTCAPKGCVRTQGYWGSKPDVPWFKYDRNMVFYASGLTWQEVFDSPPRGDAYFILAHQYIAAVLNLATGASAPNSLRSVVVAANIWFNTAQPGVCIKGACQLQRAWASVLYEYNNGDYPGAPKHCAED